jgi:hypothetical protein
VGARARPRRRPRAHGAKHRRQAGPHGDPRGPPTWARGGPSRRGCRLQPHRSASGRGPGQPGCRRRQADVGQQAWVGLGEAQEQVAPIGHHPSQAGPLTKRVILRGVAEHVRVRKVSTRDGRPEMLDDGHVVEGTELQSPTPGMPYSVRRSVVEHDDAPDVFRTSPIRAVITDKAGAIILLTDNSRYAVEVIGR